LEDLGISIKDNDKEKEKKELMQRTCKEVMRIANLFAKKKLDKRTVRIIFAMKENNANIDKLGQDNFGVCREKEDGSFEITIRLDRYEDKTTDNKVFRPSLVLNTLAHELSHAVVSNSDKRKKIAKQKFNAEFDTHHSPLF